VYTEGPAHCLIVSSVICTHKARQGQAGWLELYWLTDMKTLECLAYPSSGLGCRTAAHEGQRGKWFLGLKVIW